jgi:hypothetical protein
MNLSLPHHPREKQRIASVLNEKLSVRISGMLPGAATIRLYQIARQDCPTSEVCPVWEAAHD